MWEAISSLTIRGLYPMEPAKPSACTAGRHLLAAAEPYTGRSHWVGVCMPGVPGADLLGSGTKRPLRSSRTHEGGDPASRSLKSDTVSEWLAWACQRPMLPWPWGQALRYRKWSRHLLHGPCATTGRLCKRTALERVCHQNYIWWPWAETLTDILFPPQWFPVDLASTAHYVLKNLKGLGI